LVSRRITIIFTGQSCLPIASDKRNSCSFWRNGYNDHY
jgi:hypothetical protein